MTTVEYVRSRPRFGHLKVGDGRAYDVARVTLNGCEIEGVIELDDTEGWLRRYGEWDGESRNLPIVGCCGEVEVWWRPEAQWRDNKHFETHL